MNLRFTAVFAFIVFRFLGTNLIAQCSTTTCTIPVPAVDAMEACILSSQDDLDCYFGEMTASTPVSFPPFWCTSIENNHWFAFTATSVNVSFQIEAMNCSSGGAIQAAILQTSNCVDFTFVSDCLGNIPSGTTQALANNIPLIPGNVYYLMLDGSAGAQCNYNINGSSLITSGPQNLCIPGVPATYTSNSIGEWTIVPANMGTFLGNNIGTSINVNWVMEGTAQICLQTQSCMNAPINCMTVIVGEAIEVTHTHILCAGESVVCNGILYTVPGIFQHQVPSPSGCDSLITCNIIAIPPIVTNLGVVPLPCDGKFEVCGEILTSLGGYQVLCQSWSGCDSLVQFQLEEGDVLADAGDFFNLTCNAANQVVLDGSASSQGANFAPQWTTTDGNIVSGAASFAPVVDAEGTYCLTVTNLSSGCVMTDCIVVDFVEIFPTISITPAVATCDGSNTQLQAQTNVSIGANYAWTTVNGNISSGANTLQPTINGPGNYCLTVTIPNGCETVECIEVAAKIPVTIVGPSLFCPGQGSMTHEVTTLSSAQSVTMFLQIDNGSVQQVQLPGGQSSFSWTNTLDSAFVLKAWAEDATGCISDTATLVVNESSAQVEFTQVQTVCNSAQLTAHFVGSFQSTAALWQWSNGSDSSETTISQNGWYFVTVTDNYGCEWAASIFATLDYSSTCAYLQGTVRNNLPADCLPTANDVPLEGWIVEASGTNGTYYGTTDIDGKYFIPVSPGDYTLIVLLPSGNGFDACANNFSATLAATGAYFTQDFLVFQIPDCPYMTVDISTSILRRCMSNFYYVHYCNEGSLIAEDAYVLITLDPNLAFQAANIPAISLGNNMYRFEVGDLQPGQCGDFQIISFLACNVPIGQVHCVTAQVFPNTLCMGYGPSEFTDQDCRPNIASYDPNDKTASPPGTGSQHFVEAGTELTYQIRFQNIGTDTAFHVVLRDTLADMFEFASLEAGASSHPYTMDFYGQRVLRFTFNGIKLPPESVNEQASIGSVQFKIRLKDSLAPLTLIENTASIYFDYNEPVATNTYFHTIGLPPVHTYQTIEICNGQTYAFNGQNLTQAGEYTANLASTLGGDSTVHLTLVVHPNAITELEAQICEGESVVFNGDTLTQSGDFKITLQTVFGCDSIVNLSLDVWPAYDLLPTVAICTGTTYPFNGQELDQPGTYLGQFSTIHGCDSTVMLTLELVDEFNIGLSESICAGDSYLFDNQVLTQSGVYVANLISVGGCDSTVTLNLTELPPATGTLELSICEGESIVINGQEVSEADTFSYVLTAWNGCDSIVTVVVEVLPVSSTNLQVAICEGQSYPFNGQILTTSGIYTDTLSSANGCDSMLTLILLVSPAPEAHVFVTVIQGTVYNGITISADTTIAEILTDMDGCISTVFTHFTVVPNSTQNLAQQIGFEVFPNPTNGDFNIRFNLKQQTGVSLKVLDVVGRAMKSGLETRQFTSGEHTIKIGAEDWPSGVYLVHFQTDMGIVAARLVVQ